ncbi:EMAL-like protein, partial [Mya arenaria]
MSYIVVIYNRQANRQRHYKEHTEDMNIDVHPNKNIVASGQYASRKKPDN